MKCKCGDTISVFLNTEDMTECCDCYRRYVLRGDKWRLVSKQEFRRIYKTKYTQ